MSQHVKQLAAAVRNWLPSAVQVNNPKSAQLARDSLAELERLAADVWAFRVLDAWSEKHSNTWAMDKVGGVWLCLGAHYLDALDTESTFFCEGPSASAARITAAEALVKEDPSLAVE